MTDPFEPDPVEDAAQGSAASRAEDAFRAALAARASEVDFAPFDPVELALRAQLRARELAAEPTPEPAEAPALEPARVPDSGLAEVVEPRRRRPARVLFALAAAVLLVVAVPLGLVLMRTGSSSMSAAGAAAPAAPAGAAVTTSSAAESANDSGASPSGAAAAKASPALATSALPAPALGRRYESFLDVVIQVPDFWGYARALQSDWCGDPSTYAKPAGPFVALDPAEGGVRTIGCLGDIPDARQVEHVEWVRATASSIGGERTANGWVYSSRVMGSALVTYVHRPGVDAGVLASAVVVAQDHNGCPAVAPGGAASARPAPVTLPGAPASGVLCEYLDQPSAPGPSLVTSRALGAAAASALLADIEAGEVVAGRLPDANCVATPDATPAVVARFVAGGAVREVWLSGGCSVPTFDDGALVRRATRPACTSIYTPPLARWSWNGAVYPVCAA